MNNLEKFSVVCLSEEEMSGLEGGVVTTAVVFGIIASILQGIGTGLGLIASAVGLYTAVKKAMS